MHPSLLIVAELEYVNEPTNMKNYFNQSFQYVERQITLAVDLGRRSDSKSKHEAMRLLGSALHTLEGMLPNIVRRVPPDKSRFSCSHQLR